ncbi:class I SAM-dependent methyltransferase [Ruania halotolerans]|uniref:class I SAM-dependent methyltransferase n=1 Tax=Ruania halotolerans TaxID=2897773 RepID=UPI001E570E28|nr:class I SAM-dependent methyltransferase [Ruania halotolerans]UFU06518.1 class I SAM-dependent methyltransferase [Ruania halotolerans]
MDRVVHAYGARVAEYVEKVGSIEAVHPEDFDLVLSWARGLRGPVIDVGCGPGQWTDALHRSGVEIEGVDPTLEFLDSARTHFPDVGFRLGRAEDLGVPDGSLAGALTWYSLIHTEPERIDASLESLARALRPEGGLLIGFFAGADGESGPVPFDHKVVRAYRWPVAALVARVVRAGFDVLQTVTRIDPGHRPHGAIRAQRTPEPLTVERAEKVWELRPSR